jgi:molecular chaperone GrpE
MNNHNHNHKHEKHEHPHQHAHTHPTDEAKKQDETAQAPSGKPQATAASAQQEKPQPPIDKKDNGERAKDRETIEQLNAQVAAGNDKYLRLMAEFDNFKRRTAKEYQQLIEQANEKLMKDIIDVRENFERAFKTHKEGTDPKPFVDGMKMIFAKLDNVLHKHGLEVYCETGQEFDPQLHDAMMKVPHADIPEHHIAEVCEKGYRLRGKVIKHSRVIVSCGAQTAAAEGDPKKEEETVFEVAIESQPKKEKNNQK